MELISTIVNELTNISISLTSPLIKTKVLATRLQNTSLLQWVNNELTGYKDLESIPSYRKTTGEICGDYINGNWKVTNQAINMPKFDEEFTKKLYTMDFSQSIQTLESLNASGESYVAEFFGEDQKRALQGFLMRQNPYLQIFKLYLRTPSNIIPEILSHVRDSLLGFMLELEQEYSYISEIKELKLHNKEITKIMSNIFYSNGDGNLFNTGDNNNIKSNVTINKGNKEHLKEQLLRSNMQIDHINELLAIVDLEKPKSKDVFGEQVNSWIRNMLNKALDGTWQIGIGAAGGVLATALQQYYGIQ